LPLAWWWLAGLLPSEERLWLPLLVLLTPLGFSAFIVTPDLPLLCAWLMLLRAVLKGEAWRSGFWAAACLWSKSTVLLALPFALWVLARRLSWGKALGAAMFCLLLYSPHLLWSLQHEGLPWRFQMGRPLHFGLPELLLGQLLVLSPWVAWALLQAWRQPLDNLDRELRLLSLTLFISWLLISLLYRVEANWPMLSWPAALLMLARRRKRQPFFLAGLLTLSAVLILPLLDLWQPFSGPPRGAARLRSCLEQQSDLPLVAGRYQEKALLDHVGVPVAYLPWAKHRMSQYDLWETSAPPCDFNYLGNLEQLAGRCQGQISSSLSCGQQLLECRCVSLDDSQRSASPLL